MTPDYDRAATKAMELLVSRHVTETPIDSLSMLLDYPGVRVMSFTEFAANAGIDRKELIPLFGENSDAATFQLHMPGMEGIDYVVVYNMRLPFVVIWRAIARELGHIVLGHDGQTRSTEVRMQEAICFAHHLISPRPVLHMLMQSGLTANVLTATTGCSDECVEEIRQIPGARVPRELNAQVRDQFARGIKEYIRFHQASPKADNSGIIDLGTFMDNYEE